MTAKTPHALSLLLATGALAAAPSAFAIAVEVEPEGDGAPHIAVAQEEDGALELEFEVQAGLDLSTPAPTITLDVNLDSFLSTSDAFIFRSAPLGDRPDPDAALAPNEDLGFVSEVEGIEEEGAALAVEVSVRLLASDDGFSATFGGEDIFTEADNFVFDLGDAFDAHPTYQLTADSADFTGSVSAAFEIFETASGNVIGGYTLVLDTQPIPEPASAAVLAAAGTLLLRRRRSA